MPFNNLHCTSWMHSKWVASQQNYLIYTCCLELQCYHSYHQIKHLREAEPLSLSMYRNSVLLIVSKPSFFFFLWLFQATLCCFFIFLFYIFLHGEGLQAEGQLWGSACPSRALDVWHGVPAARPGWGRKIVDHRLHISHLGSICPHSNISFWLKYAVISKRFRKKLW